LHIFFNCRHTWEQDHKSSGTLYKCRDFENCSHYYRIRNINGTTWSLQESGSHNHSSSQIYSSQSLFGIHPKFKVEVDRLLKNGLTPITTYNALKDLCTQKLWEAFAIALPTRQQITNRRKVLSRTGLFNLDIVQDLQVHSILRLIYVISISKFTHLSRILLLLKWLLLVRIFY